MKMIRSLALAVILSLCVSTVVRAQNEHAFIWDSVHGMQDLGTLGGNTSYATGINDSGVVTGYSYLSHNHMTHAFIWTASGGMVDIGTPASGKSSQSSAINSVGNIAGAGAHPPNQTPAFYSTAGGWQVLPYNRINEGNYSNYAFAINDANQVTGQRYIKDVLHGFLWDTNSGQVRFLAPLPGGLHAGGNGINSLGQICGEASDSHGHFIATLWEVPGRARVIGALNQTDSQAQSINDNQEVVGFNYVLAGFYWSAATHIVPLQSLGGTVSAPFRITNTGQIAGYSSNSSGATHAVLWNNYTSAPQDLGTLPGGTNSYGRDVNSSGVVVGYADVP